MRNSQPKWMSDCGSFSRKTRNSAEWLRLRSEPLGLVRPPSVPIRIAHWELNIDQIPIGHSAKLFLRKPLVRSLIVQRDETRPGAVLHDVGEPCNLILR